MARDKADELTEFVRALRRRARQVRRRAFHDKEWPRLRAFANYLDAHADTVEAKPAVSRVAEVPSVPPQLRLDVAS
jgi:hypothetical protein